MSDEQDGGPAFPPNAGWRDNMADGHGMSLRDYFAAAIAGGDAADGGWSDTAEGSVVEGRAKLYYRIADAMLRARSAQ